MLIALHRKKELEKEIIDSYRSFIDYYCNERDMEAIKSLFHPEITNIGSGEDEFTLTYDAVSEIFERDIQQCPCKLTYDEKHLKVMVISQDQALVVSEFDTKTVINENPLETKGYRYSILWQKPEEKWLIRHIHLSRAEPNLQQGESFPITDLSERNNVLEKLVNKRTRELCQLNINLAEANKEISEIKQRFEIIFEKASDGIIVADWENHSFFMVNQRICDNLGYRKKEMSDFWLSDLIPADQYQQSLSKILKETDGQTPIAESIPLKCSNGEIRFFDVTSQAIRINKKNFLVSLYRDITEHKQAILLKKEAEIAQKASEAKNIFLANMSHEIRTPVTGIIGMSEILTKTELSHRQKDYLSIITDSSKILLNLINDILDISKIEAGKLELKTEKFKLSELLENIKTLIKPGLINKNNQFKVTISHDVPSILESDRMRLEQILMNLLNNAIKFTENGEIHLFIEKLSNEKDFNQYKVKITDSGIGISPNDQMKLFQKFQQVETPLSEYSDGSGLGLYICRQLVNLLGGEIGVDSESGKGSSFWFTFQSKENNIGLEEYVSTETNIDTSLNMKVLLVDDKRVNLQVISLMLQTANCQIDTALNGLEALYKFEPEKHQVILMDIMMPLMDGITAMKELRKRHQELPPIIAITANAMAGDKEKYLNEGFDAYITKPLTMNKLLSELAGLGVINTKTSN